MKRKLKYLALTKMNGQKVIVHDLVYDCYDQICEVKVKEIWKAFYNSKKQQKENYKILKVILFNEEFFFEYDYYGNCINGNFEVYSLCQKGC